MATSHWMMTRILLRRMTTTSPKPFTLAERDNGQMTDAEVQDLFIVNLYLYFKIYLDLYVLDSEMKSHLKHIKANFMEKIHKLIYKTCIFSMKFDICFDPF